ncbi:MAG: VWA domain-containing protein [Candidatus Omnitrophica bacterium]|nr:VWA domain-containing protein [Candidatus Omnitrophota bacterium]MCM8826303.1 VWA domain-containing protein [Candidatus Omnitrophota bacterium]
MIIENPIFLWLIPISVFIVLYSQRKNRLATIPFPSEKFLNINKPTYRIIFIKNLWILRLLVLILFSLGLSRWRIPIYDTKIETEGIDIVLILDTSTSMLAEDFTLYGKRINRLDAVKDVVERFIHTRKNDRIGVVVFAAKAYTVSPLTFDYNWIVENLERVKIGMIDDGTAIGSAILVGLNRLKESKAKSKIIILLTDGVNNAGKISPIAAANVAKSLGVRIYTIGAGTKGVAPYPVKDFFGKIVYKPIEVDIDEQTLMDISKITDGRYFRATDTKSLREIYEEINRLEKSPIQDKGYAEYKELFPIFVSGSMLFLFLEVLLNSTILRKIP